MREVTSKFYEAQYDLSLALPYQSISLSAGLEIYDQDPVEPEY